jgi:hypothetical protein
VLAAFGRRLTQAMPLVLSISLSLWQFVAVEAVRSVNNRLSKYSFSPRETFSAVRKLSFGISDPQTSAGNPSGISKPNFSNRFKQEEVEIEVAWLCDEVGRPKMYVRRTKVKIKAKFTANRLCRSPESSSPRSDKCFITLLSVVGLAAILLVE